MNDDFASALIYDGTSVDDIRWCQSLSPFPFSTRNTMLMVVSQAMLNKALRDSNIQLLSTTQDTRVGARHS